MEVLAETLAKWKVNPGAIERTAKFTFQQADVNKNNFIDKNEARSMLKNLFLASKLEPPTEAVMDQIWEKELNQVDSTEVSFQQWLAFLQGIANRMELPKKPEPTSRGFMPGIGYNMSMPPQQQQVGMQGGYNQGMQGGMMNQGMGMQQVGNRHAMQGGMMAPMGMQQQQQQQMGMQGGYGGMNPMQQQAQRMKQQQAQRTAISNQRVQQTRANQFAAIEQRRIAKEQRQLQQRQQRQLNQGMGMQQQGGMMNQGMGMRQQGGMMNQGMGMRQQGGMMNQGTGMRQQGGMMNQGMGMQQQGGMMNQGTGMGGGQKCLKCEGKGGMGSFGACTMQDVHFKKPCPTCNGTGHSYLIRQCTTCQGKGGMGPFGPCESHDVHYKSPCSSCGGRCYF